MKHIVVEAKKLHQTYSMLYYYCCCSIIIIHEMNMYGKFIHYTVVMK